MVREVEVERMMTIKVKLKDQFQLFNVQTWNLSVLCGQGTQPLRWLAYAACARLASNSGVVPAKFIPQAVKYDGIILDADKAIRELLNDGAEVEIDSSRGPEAFTAKWSGKSPNKALWPHTSNPTKMVEPNSILALPPEEQRVVLDRDNIVDKAFSRYCGLFQSLLIWYSSQGEELEDKDFGVLNLEQFSMIFLDANLLPTPLDEIYITSCFNKALQENFVPGAYQLSMSDLVIAIVHVATGFSYRSEIGDESQVEANVGRVLENVDHLIQDVLAPSLTTTLRMKLEELNVAGDNSLIQKWLIFGEYWIPSLVALLVIYALQKDVSFVDFAASLSTMSFGVSELQKFLFGAAFYKYKGRDSPIKISTEAFLRAYLENFLCKANVERPLYSTYEEKKAYLRSILIRHG